MTGSTASKSIWNTLMAFGLVLITLPFALYAFEKGFRFNNPVEQAVSRLFQADDRAASTVLYLHMVTGGLITILAPFQMLRAIRDRWPRIHHFNGYLVASAAGVTAIAGLFYIFRLGTIGGPIMSTGFSLYGCLMLLAAWKTVQYGRLRQPLHGLWAGRLIILALASWLYRVHYGVWDLTTGGLGSRADFSGPFDVVQVFAFYMPYLIVHHIWWLRRG